MWLLKMNHLLILLMNRNEEEHEKEHEKEHAQSIDKKINEEYNRIGVVSHVKT
jgi:hypothetical protein